MKQSLRWLAGVAVALLAASACTESSDPSDDDGGSSGSGTNGGSQQQLCADNMACIAGNAMDEQACVVDATGSEVQAQIAGCEAEYAGLLQCLVENSTCDNGIYGVASNACDADSRAFGDCMSNASGPVGNPPVTSSDAKAICAMIASCEALTQLETYWCEIDFDESLDVAAAYGCSTEIQALQTCVQSTGTCVDGRFVSTCPDEGLDYTDCVAQASGIG